MSVTSQLDQVLITKAVLRRVIAELEGALGIDGALPITMALLEAMNEADQIEGKFRRQV